MDFDFDGFDDPDIKLPPIRTFAVTVADESADFGKRTDYVYAHRFDIELGGILAFGTGIVLMAGGKPTAATLMKVAYKEWLSVTEIEKPALSH